VKTTVAKVDRVLFVHPVWLDLDAADGSCCGFGCGRADSPLAGVPALVDYRFGVAYVPPLSPSGVAVVDPGRDFLLFVELCLPCASHLDEACGWTCVPFDVEVEA
jgi:hypothetical protein